MSRNYIQVNFQPQRLVQIIPHYIPANVTAANLILPDYVSPHYTSISSLEGWSLLDLSTLDFALRNDIGFDSNSRYPGLEGRAIPKCKKLDLTSFDYDLFHLTAFRARSPFLISPDHTLTTYPIGHNLTTPHFNLKTSQEIGLKTFHSGLEVRLETQRQTN